MIALDYLCFACVWEYMLIGFTLLFLLLLFGGAVVLLISVVYAVFILSDLITCGLVGVLTVPIVSCI